MPDYLERAYWPADADSRHGPYPEDYDARYAELNPDTKSEIDQAASPEKRSPAQDDHFDKAKLAGGLLLGGLVAAGLLWAVQKVLDPKGPKPD